MPIDVKSFATARRFAPEKLQKLNLFETANFFLDVYCLEPGQEQKPHAHAGSDKVYAVLEGQAEVRVGSETCVVWAGEAVLCPGGSEHGIANRSAARVSALVMMAPRP